MPAIPMHVWTAYPCLCLYLFITIMCTAWIACSPYSLGLDLPTLRKSQAPLSVTCFKGRAHAAQHAGTYADIHADTHGGGTHGAGVQAKLTAAQVGETDVETDSEVEEAVGGGCGVVRQRMAVAGGWCGYQGQRLLLVARVPLQLPAGPAAAAGAAAGVAAGGSQPAAAAAGVAAVAVGGSEAAGGALQHQVSHSGVLQNQVSHRRHWQVVARRSLREGLAGFRWVAFRSLLYDAM